MTHQLFPRTKDAELLAIFFYELEMLNATAQLYDPRDEKHSRSAILESFLLHARNLIEFFEGKPKYDDDLTCLDFLDEEGKPIQGVVLNFPNTFKTALHKHLAHMSKVRVKHKPGWEIEKIRIEMNKEAKKFIEKCSPTNFPTKDGREKEMALKGLSELISYRDKLTP